MAATETAAPSFPLPPPFFKLYADDDGVRPLPPPPPPPPQGQIPVYGQLFDPEEPVVPPLQGRQVYQTKSDGSVDIRSELDRLLTELMLLFSELLRSLEEAPQQYAPHLNALNQVLSNMQHLINMARPVQARVTLEYVLKLQIREKQEALAKIRSQVESFGLLVGGAARDLQQQLCAAEQAAAGSGGQPPAGAE
eukprot:CAMPEP_0202902324 /NCGR_PEP_ID=MMETSP1392-20130828/16789_1 /ASSEMBLY_ACC=CAM_ASM_000868 /TAXON_ID=225041 /ORGANISM="Chlamydomonas chlamydogama, Strain SAG 11-48b" /LENGTH=193 /DNA_ID=CAMNT_0049589073 /DNA_START=74 /DNA_END=652 /DNA_ORIENTATION=-